MPLYIAKLHQLDILNDFLDRNLIEQTFLEQPKGYVAQAKTFKLYSIKCDMKGLEVELLSMIGQVQSDFDYSWLSSFNVDPPIL